MNVDRERELLLEIDDPATARALGRLLDIIHAQDALVKTLVHLLELDDEEPAPWHR